MSETDLTPLMDQLGYQFKDISLLERALTHRSIPGDNNERLEFLGDSILGFVMASELFKKRPQAREGELSRVRSLLVNSESLATIARGLNLGHYMRLGSGEQKTGGESRPSILADAVEAIIGAMYLDADLATVRQCLLQWSALHFDDLATIEPQKDPKSRLQEWLQSHSLPLPLYDCNASGAAHAQSFHVVCTVEGLPHKAEGNSTSRRRAEQAAAQHYLDQLGE